MNVWGFDVMAPTLDRAAAAWLLHAGLMGATERRYFERTVEPGQVVVDVGANQGIFTLLFSRLVGRQGRVIALEPAPSLFAALERNCRANGAANVTPVAAAAGGARGRGALQCGRFNKGDNRMTSPGGERATAVDIVPLDELVPDGKADLVKIDVQGYEMQVVSGMAGIVDRSPAIKILFEYWPAGLARAGADPADLIGFFVERRFSLFDLSADGPRRLDAAALPAVRGWTNFLAVRD